ncbi:MAG: cation-translocating P-type ATPase C-terminal domain-containing protein, partial [Pseudomonadota bacterium]
LGLDGTEATTVSFLTIAFAQLFLVLGIGDTDAPLLKRDAFNNRWIWLSIGLCTCLILLALYIEPIALVLELSAPTPTGWLLVLTLAVIPLLFSIMPQLMNADIEKLWNRLKSL